MGIKLQFRRPGKPTGTPLIESFNSRHRQEYLDQSRFVSIEDAQKVNEDWHIIYNENRPHNSLKYRTPSVFVTTWDQNYIPEKFLDKQKRLHP